MKELLTQNHKSPATQLDVIRQMTMEQRWHIAQRFLREGREWKKPP